MPDYLVWRLTNQDLRSVCTLTCKWLFVSNEKGHEWDVSFWQTIGLSDLIEGKGEGSFDFSKIGSDIEKPFVFVDKLKISNETQGLTGLNSNCKVGVSMIDAHAGGVGGKLSFIN